MKEKPAYRQAGTRHGVAAKLNAYNVGAENKEYEFWQRDSLAIPFVHTSFLITVRSNLNRPLGFI